MNILNFGDLLTAAGQQPEPQLLLFVFAKAELPEGQPTNSKKALPPAVAEH